MLLCQMWQPAADATARQAGALASLLIYLFILVLVFLVASLAILRASRRFRALQEHRRAQPTPTDDVWAMHKLPEGAVDAIPDDPRRDPAEDDDDRA
jgi:hypothetical protein